MTSTITQHRRIALHGAHNVRDLGGYPSRFGGAVRWGRVYRADRLDELTDDDVGVLRSLGLAAVYDLRTAQERGEAPDRIPSVHVPLLAEGGIDDLGISEVVDRDDGVRFLTELLLKVLHGSGIEIGAIVYALADADQMPVMFHCTAGKDRTGLLAALLLELLGVARDDVLDDFELSAQFHRPSNIRTALERFAAHGVPPEAAAGLLSAPRTVMSEVLRVLDGRFGGVERYLAEQCGIDRGAIGTIRSNLLG